MTQLVQHPDKMGIRGVLMVLSPVPFFFTCLHITHSIWHFSFASITAFCCFLSALTLFSHPKIGKLFASISLLCITIIALPYLIKNPFEALLGAVLLISAGYALLDFNPNLYIEKHKSYQLNKYAQQARWAALTVSGMIIFSVILDISDGYISRGTITVSFIICIVFINQWALHQISSKIMWFILICSIILLVLILLSLFFGHTQLIAFIISFFIYCILPRSIMERREHWWEIMLNHPSRLLISTFFILIIFGIIVLLIPASTRQSNINLVDAAFTSVSAVCVTGLIVLDTPNEFTLLGQIFILILIQLGGLGIMSITTVALHAIGRRLSLRQEYLLTTMTDTDHKNLITSLATILKFTFIIEGIGATVLTCLIYPSSESFIQAIWHGVFTSISAFCNAGFALKSNSLIPYQSMPMILHVIACLIILGGMAPATSLAISKWYQNQSISLTARIALITTGVLLVSGTFFILVFEWHGIFADLSLCDKLNNAWFQSVTLRTAGFNSVDISHTTSPTFLIMLGLMFIGGSPGGTAGGIKTTTLGVLAMTFWASITNKNEIIVKHRKIPYGTIYRAITIVISGVCMWFIMVIMLEVTQQQISGRDIIFEVTSAIGTVGLSTGVTASLDEVGKVIIMIAMFAGRIGPMTLLMILSKDHSPPMSHSPETKISLT